MVVYVPMSSLPNAAVERRLRKMSQESLPTLFMFQVQAQVLCVGEAVVYRVAINVSTQTQAQETQASWIIAMSKAKYCGFYNHLVQLLAQPEVQNYLTPSDENEWKPLDKLLLRVQVLVDTYADFTNGFVIYDDVQQMYTHARTLETFLSAAWEILECIIPSLAVIKPEQSTTLSREIVDLYVLMREFLAFPESLLEKNAAYAQAILKLEEFVVEDGHSLISPNAQEHVCSICLEKLLPGNNVDVHELNDSRDTQIHSVKLPCGHLFHENCIMAWLKQSPTCPTCRATVD